MELSTARRLAELNRQFYDEHGENFADARPRLPAGARQVLAQIAPGARVLEVGCGDGKVARALPQAHYVGVDQSEAMLARADRYGTGDRRSGTAVFIQADLLEADWDQALPAGRFDWVLAFAVFHHLPGSAARAGVMGALAARLAPGGRLAMSNWQLSRSERALRRIQPWAAAGLQANDVESGDYLLSWERKGRHGLRYVHLLDLEEARRLAGRTGLEVVEWFSADGASGDLADYVLCQTSPQSRIPGKLD